MKMEIARSEFWRRKLDLTKYNYTTEDAKAAIKDILWVLRQENYGFNSITIIVGDEQQNLLFDALLNNNQYYVELDESDTEKGIFEVYLNEDLRFDYEFDKN